MNRRNWGKWIRTHWSSWDLKARRPRLPLPDQIKELYDSGEFSGKALEIAILHRPAGLKAKRLVLAGGGKREKFDAAELRKLIGAVVRSLKS